jgi:hypothetical protein
MTVSREEMLALADELRREIEQWSPETEHLTLLNRVETALRSQGASGELRQDGWREIDEAAKSGDVFLLRHGLADEGSIYAGYYGMAQKTMGCGADAKFPWVFLDPTNGVNHMRDGDTGFTHYRHLASQAPSEARMVHRTSEPASAVIGHQKAEDDAS